MVVLVAPGSHTGSGLERFLTVTVSTFIGRVLVVRAAHVRPDAKTLPLSLSRPLGELPLLIPKTWTSLMK